MAKLDGKRQMNKNAPVNFYQKKYIFKRHTHPRLQVCFINGTI